METAINVNSVPNQVNQKMVNQDKSTIMNGDIFLNLFQDMLVGVKNEGVESPIITINETTKEEQLNLVSQAILKDFHLSSITTELFNVTVDDTEESLLNTDDVTLDSLLVQLQSLFQNPSNLADDFKSWYEGLKMDQKRSFDQFILQWQANTHFSENQQLDVASLFKQLTNEQVILTEMISNFLKDSQSIGNFALEKEVQVVNSSLIEQSGILKNQNQPLVKEKLLFPTAVAQVDLTRMTNLNGEIPQQTEQEQAVLIPANRSLADEATPIDIRQLQSSFSHHLLATREGQNTPASSSVVYGEVNAKDLSSELGKLMMKNIKLPNGVTEMKIQLHPHELGKIDINLTSQQGNLTAIFLADSVVGKEMLESSLHLLKHSLVQQGIQIDRIEVVSSTSNNVLSGDNSNHHLPFNHQNSGSQHQNSKGFYLEDEPQLYNEEDIHELMDIDEVSGSLLETRGINYTV